MSENTEGVQKVEVIEVEQSRKKHSGIMRRIREEFENDSEEMSFFGKMRANALKDKSLQKSVVKRLRVALNHEIDSCVKEYALEAYERDINHSLTKDEIYRKYTEQSHQGKLDALTNLETYAINTFEATQENLINLYDSQKVVVDGYQKRLDDGIINQTTFDKRVAGVEKKGEELFLNLEKTVDTFYSDVITAFVQTVKNFKVSYTENLEE